MPSAISRISDPVQAWESVPYSSWTVVVLSIRIEIRELMRKGSVSSGGTGQGVAVAAILSRFPLPCWHGQRQVREPGRGDYAARSLLSSMTATSLRGAFMSFRQVEFAGDGGIKDPRSAETAKGIRIRPWDHSRVCPQARSSVDWTARSCAGPKSADFSPRRMRAMSTASSR